jgi:hypothetical protein
VTENSCFSNLPMNRSWVYMVGVDAPDRQRIFLRDRAHTDERRAVPRKLESGAALKMVGD